MDTNMLLYIALIIYIIVMALGFFLKMRALFMIGAIIWFIPIFEINNSFIILVSSAMILIHGYMAFFTGKDEDF